jgi:hypothetical protein
LFLLAVIVGDRPLLSAVLILDGCIFIGIGIAVFRKAGEASLPARFARLWGVVAVLVGVGALVDGLGRAL